MRPCTETENAPADTPVTAWPTYAQVQDHLHEAERLRSEVFFRVVKRIPNAVARLMRPVSQKPAASASSSVRTGAGPAATA